MRARTPWPLMATAVVAGSAGWAARAGAAPNPAARTSSLAWIRSDGAESCIGGKDLAEDVERVLGRRVFVSASAADVAVEGHVDRTAQGWKATLRISDDHGTVLGSRELESPAADCRAMDESIAFVIAVMIDPDAAARPQAPIASPERPATAAPAPASPPALASSSSHWQIVPRVGLSTAIGELPDAAWGATAGLRVGPPAIGVELFGTSYLPQDATVSGNAGATVRFTWASGGVALCPTLARFSPFSIVGCAGALGGVLTATPTGGLDHAQESNSFVVLGTARARLEWRIARALFASVDVGADVPFERPEWIATSPSGAPISVFRPSAVAGEAGLSVGLVLE